MASDSVDAMEIGRNVVELTVTGNDEDDVVVVVDVESVNLFLTFLLLCQSKCELFNLE